MSTATVVAPRPNLSRLIAGYVEFTKPRIVMLVLVTGVPALLIAERGMPGARVALAGLLGTALAAMSAACFNHYYDRDIDGLMRRTASRPLPSGLIPPSHALILGFALGVAALFTLAVFTNLLAAPVWVSSMHLATAVALLATLVITTYRLASAPVTSPVLVPAAAR